MVDFEQFYFAVHGRAAFPWQRRLAQQVAAEGWPDDWVLKLPTASGKTSLLDIAVFALAAQAGRAARERTAPLRTFFVVDRRLVVDDVSRHAKKLRSALTSSESEVLGEVKQRLLMFGSGCPLRVATLRGGMYRSDTWADLPNQPLICVSTVDQVGSRLLFRGYGVSEKRRSVDAALVGCDSLIIVDEAHLSEPFLQTIRSVRKYAGWGECQLPQARLIEMSATAKGEVGFALAEEDYEDGALAPRLNAEKMAELREAADLEEEAAAAARHLASRPMTNVVGIVLNTVNGARAVFERLKNGEDQAVLLTGRIRPFDRDLLLKKFLERIKAGRHRDEDRRLFVVATQTIEVGADLDFDALVTEVAALDALRQRFGRLDRLGELKSTEAVILRRKRRKGEVDRIYGEAADRVWEWLNARAQDDGSRGLIDFGARRMTELYEREKPEGVNTNPGRAPILTPAHIETWVQTYPTPAPDPEVAPFLHGLDAASADVNLIWRADLDYPLESWTDIVQSAPPLTTEALPIPIWVAAAWLRKQPLVQASDLEGTEETSEEQKSLEHETGPRQFLIWRGPEDSRSGKVADIRPGDTLLVRSDEGGADDYGWNPRSALPVRDIGNQCTTLRAEQAGGRYIVRVHPDVLFPRVAAEDEDYAGKRETLIRDLELLKTEEDPEASERILELVQDCARRPGRGDWMERSDPLGNVFFTTRWMKAIALEPSPDVSVEETGEGDSSSMTVCVSLTAHVDGVTETVCRFTEGCGVDSEIAAALRRSAEFHDLGKYDERFQMMLDPVGQKTELLGKGEIASSRAEYERRRRLAGYPRGARHEIWSVALAQKAPDLVDHPARDLILYLIGTHHGHGRPFVPVWDEEEDFAVTAEREGLQANAAEVKELWRFGSGWVDRFWSLSRKYGYWGLAYLEAILRRADCVQSRKEEGKANDRH